MTGMTFMLGRVNERIPLPLHPGAGRLALSEPHCTD